jgi:hypothetical protein
VFARSDRAGGTAEAATERLRRARRIAGVMARVIAQMEAGARWNDALGTVIESEPTLVYSIKPSTRESSPVSTRPRARNKR